VRKQRPVAVSAGNGNRTAPANGGAQLTARADAEAHPEGNTWLMNAVAALTAALTLAGVVPPLGAGATAVAQTRAAGSLSAKCATSALVVWLDTRGDSAAGSTFFSLKFTNLSGHECTLVGYPGVSAVDLAGHQLGSAASRNPSTPHLVRLASGASATAVLRIAVAGNYPNSTCRRVKAAGLRVYPPNQTASKVVPFPFEACSRKGPVYLSVAAVKKGL
jgi:uncharacterized protein DUF4232